MQVTDTEIIIPRHSSGNSRKLRDSSLQLRITHEGIFCPTPVFATSIAWDEIVTIAPYTLNLFGKHPFLGIVPRDYDALIARVIEEHSMHAWQRAWYHVLDRANTWLSHCSNTRAPIHIFESSWPISIDELIAAIQERFAVELREYHIPVLGWQN